MIDLYATWIPQIIGYATLIADDDAVRAAWIGGDRTRTSVIDCGELIEQVFDGLDSEAMLTQAKASLSDEALLAALTAFLERLLEVETNARPAFDSERILASESWVGLKIAAAHLATFRGV